MLRLPKETKFLLISLETLILKIVPKTALEFLFRISFSIIGRIPPVYTFTPITASFRIHIQHHGWLWNKSLN
jgi:hypothetical protein